MKKFKNLCSYNGAYNQSMKRTNLATNRFLVSYKVYNNPKLQNLKFQESIERKIKSKSTHITLLPMELILLQNKGWHRHKSLSIQHALIPVARYMQWGVKTIEAFKIFQSLIAFYLYPINLAHLNLIMLAINS